MKQLKLFVSYSLLLSSVSAFADGGQDLKVLNDQAQAKLKDINNQNSDIARANSKVDGDNQARELERVKTINASFERLSESVTDKVTDKRDKLAAFEKLSKVSYRKLEEHKAELKVLQGSKFGDVSDQATKLLLKITRFEEGQIKDNDPEKVKKDFASTAFIDSLLKQIKLTQESRNSCPSPDKVRSLKAQIDQSLVAVKEKQALAEKLPERQKAFDASKASLDNAKADLIALEKQWGESYAQAYDGLHKVLYLTNKSRPNFEHAYYDFDSRTSGSDDARDLYMQMATLRILSTDIFDSKIFKQTFVDNKGKAPNNFATLFKSTQISDSNYSSGMYEYTSPSLYSREGSDFEKQILGQLAQPVNEKILGVSASIDRGNNDSLNAAKALDQAISISTDKRRQLGGRFDKVASQLQKAIAAHQLAYVDLTQSQDSKFDPSQLAELQKASTSINTCANEFAAGERDLAGVNLKNAPEKLKSAEGHYQESADHFESSDLDKAVGR